MEQEAETGVLAHVGEWPELGTAHDHALVILAMNLDCELIQTGEGNFSLHAEPVQVEAILAEFELYAVEQVANVSVPEPPESPTYPWGIAWLVAWIAVLCAVFLMQAQDVTLTGRFANTSEGLVAGREWWRPFTALFLHADPGHLLGNVAIGGIFCVIVARSLGAGLGWLLILLAGTLGNALNAWLRFPDSFASIGASTATFAALGILVGDAGGNAWRFRSARGLWAVFIPVIAGFILLGWYGSGGENTDVAGHFWGWLAGVTLGALSVFIRKNVVAVDSPPIPG